MLLTGPVGLVFFFLWATTDEVALDYSDLSPIIGVADPQLNGYTFISEYLTENEFDGLEAFQSRSAFERVPADPVGIVSQIAGYEPLRLAFEESIRRPQILIDVPATPDALILSVGGLRTYVQVMITKARLHESQREPVLALESLMQAQGVVEAHSKAHGGLIHLLTSVAVSLMLSAELEGLLATNSFGQIALKTASKTYKLHQGFGAATKAAFQQEFNFSRHCIQMVIEDPAQLADEMSAAHGRRGRELITNTTKVELLLHPNRTINRFFRAYLEVIEEVDKPVCDRAFPIGEAFEADIQDRRMLWFVRSRNPVGKIFSAILFPATTKVLEVVALAEFRTRATYLSIALRRHQLDTGQLPEHLNELVPEYLSEIPKDPYDGQPLRYSRERSIIYSVGSDGLDLGGSERPFLHQLSDDEHRESAEKDELEPTFPLRFGMSVTRSASHREMHAF